MLVMPVIALYVAKEVRKLRTEEFVDAARIRWIEKTYCYKASFPASLYDVYTCIFQQFTQTLTILLHLGLLEIFFGGTVKF